MLMPFLVCLCVLPSYRSLILCLHVSELRCVCAKQVVVSLQRWRVTWDGLCLYPDCQEFGSNNYPWLIRWHELYVIKTSINWSCFTFEAHVRSENKLISISVVLVCSTYWWTQSFGFMYLTIFLPFGKTEKDLHLQCSKYICHVPHSSLVLQGLVLSIHCSS